MLTATHTGYVENKQTVEEITNGFGQKVKQLLKYTRKQLHTPQRSMVNMSDATLRDIGLSRNQLNRVSNQSRFDNPLNTLHAQSSMYYPR